MECLDLQIDEINEIQKTYTRYDFCAVSFHKCRSFCVASFNKHAKKALGDCTCFRIYANAEYIVFQPSDRNDPHAYKIMYNQSGGCTVSCKEFVRLMLSGKTYKLYNTKKGFAIKRNEPIKTESA